MAAVKNLPKKRDRIFLKSGVELTPQLEDELAAEAERGYDLSKAKLHILRQPVLADEESDALLTFARSQVEFDAARQRAQEEGRPFEDVFQEDLKRLLEEGTNPS